MRFRSLTIYFHHAHDSLRLSESQRNPQVVAARPVVHDMVVRARHGANPNERVRLVKEFRDNHANITFSGGTANEHLDEIRNNPSKIKGKSGPAAKLPSPVS